MNNKFPHGAVFVIACVLSNLASVARVKQSKVNYRENANSEHELS